MSYFEIVTHALVPTTLIMSPAGKQSTKWLAIARGDSYFFYLLLLVALVNTLIEYYRALELYVISR